MIICRSVKNSSPEQVEGHKHRDILAIMCDRSSPKKNGITRRDWITFWRDTTHQHKDGSLVPMSSLAARQNSLRRSLPTIQLSTQKLPSHKASTNKIGRASCRERV